MAKDYEEEYDDLEKELSKEQMELLEIEKEQLKRLKDKRTKLMLDDKRNIMI